MREDRDLALEERARANEGGLWGFSGDPVPSTATGTPTETETPSPTETTTTTTETPADPTDEPPTTFEDRDCSDFDTQEAAQQFYWDAADSSGDSYLSGGSVNYTDQSTRLR